MTYEFATSADNVYCIDAGMFGFDQYMSVFLVHGEKLALVDTGLPDSLARVRAGIEAHGFRVGDLDYIFVTHEHHDHCGNLGPLLRENPDIKAYIHPAAAYLVIDPSQEDKNRKQNLRPGMANRFASMEPVPEEKLNLYEDGQVFDLGGGVRLNVTFTPGHQPGGVVLYEEKYKSFFVNDLVGNCFADCDFQLTLHPPRSNTRVALEFLKSVREWDVRRLLLGHFGISEEPQKILDGAISSMQELLDMASVCYAEGGPDRVRENTYKLKMKEVEKLKTRGQELYEYMKNELVESQARLFTEDFCRSVE